MSSDIEEVIRQYINVIVTYNEEYQGKGYGWVSESVENIFNRNEIQFFVLQLISGLFV